MSWARRSGTASKYQTPEHRRERARYLAQMKRDGYLTCAQDVCVMGTRVIPQGAAWHVGHDASGTAYIGPTHQACNVRDAAVRARAKQLGSSTTGRLVL